MDEKSQVQALDRTAPILKLRPGIPEKQTHDYVRHGTTALFAALEVATGKVTDACYPRHRNEEFLKFLKQVAKAYPRKKLHLVCDNYATHKHTNVQAWLAKNPRVTLHFTPTSGSWLKMVEIFSCHGQSRAPEHRCGWSQPSARRLQPRTSRGRTVLFVVCQSIEHSGEVGQMLAQPGFIGDPGAVLEITSQSSDEALAALASVESPESPIRAIVSVNMLREGWDVKNIAVIVALRKLASQTLTEQILGRGLRLPFGKRTDFPVVDQVDLVAHDSYKQLLDQKDVLRQRIQLPTTSVEVDEHGAATTATVDPNPATSSATGTGAGAHTGTAGGETPSPGQGSLFDGLGDEYADYQSGDDSTGPVLVFRETDDRIDAPQPKPMNRVDGAPPITFPRRASRLAYAAFSLSDVSDGDAQAAGARFIHEVPSFIYRDALEATRDGGDVSITVTPQDNEEAQQTLADLDVVRADLIESIMQRPEVPKEKASKGAATRLVKAFLKGAGVTSDEASAEWGQTRRRQAVEGMRGLIRTAIGNRKQEMTYALVPVTLPIEPVMVAPDAKNAYNDKFVKHTQFVGWQKSIMPVATFDAGTTEWELAHLLDRDPVIQWWLRVYVGGPAFIPTTDGKYFPDFIALATDSGYWLVEGKADKNANDADVLRKVQTAQNWARSVRDDGDSGTWRYMFATEAHIRTAAGSWNGLLVATNPE